MNTIENYLFISNTYEVLQAKEIIQTLYKTMINYHKIENLSNQVKYDKPCNESLNAINILSEELMDIEQTLQVAKLIDKKIIIKSTFEILYE